MVNQQEKTIDPLHKIACQVVASAVALIVSCLWMFFNINTFLRGPSVEGFIWLMISVAVTLSFYYLTTKLDFKGQDIEREIEENEQQRQNNQSIN